MQHWSLEAPISPLERVETINFTLAFSLRAKKPSMYLRLASLTCDHHTQSNACRYSSTFFTDSSATNSCRDSLHYYDHLNCFRANGFDFDPYNGTKVPYVWKLVGGLSSPLWPLYRFIYHTNDSCGSEAGVDQRYPFPRSQTVSLGLLHYDHLVPLSDIRSTLNACHHPYRCH